MKIYFAGSIRAGRTDAQLYSRIIEALKAEGHTVLTEHVGDLSLQENISDRRIYMQDTAWMREADLLIAECSTPSLGVGYELAYAEAHGVPCHILYNRSKTHLSAMLIGDDYFQVHPYDSEDEVEVLLKGILE